MRSEFNNQRHLPGATSNPAVEETYDLKGLNLIAPDDIMPAGESPNTINSRMYARNDGESRVASRTRMGASFLSTPVGETLNVQNVASNTGDVPIGINLYAAQPFTPNATGPLTRIDLNIKKAAGATGHVIVEVYSDAAGIPGTIIDRGGVSLAQSSIYASTITTSYQYLPAYFIDAPTLTSGTQYWIVTYTQDNGSGTYYLDQTAATGAYSTINGGFSWSPLGYSYNYKTYLSTSGGVRGFHLRYPLDATTNRIVFAQRSNIYSMNRNTGVSTSIDSSLADATSPVRFAQLNDLTMWVDGTGPARQWDGTTVQNIGGTIPWQNPSNIIVHQNRVFIMSNNNRVDFSDLNDQTSWTSTNFFYVPAPKSPDHMTGWKIFQNNLVIFTYKTKHVIVGTDIANFTRKEAIGTKGAVSQEAIAADRNLVYFMANDKQIYAYNGVTDQLLSEKIQPELQAITDTSKVRLDLYRNQLRVYYAKTPSSTANRMVLYDLETKQWFMDTDHPVAGSTSLYLDQNQLVEFSALTGQVFYGETQYSDMGRRINYKWWTNYKTYAYRRRNGQTFGGGSAKKRIKRFRPIVRVPSSPYNLLVGKDMDFANKPDMRRYQVTSGGAVWGAFTWGDGTVWGGSTQSSNRTGMSGRGRYIQYRFERNGVETPVELYGYIAQYKVGRQK